MSGYRSNFDDDVRERPRRREVIDVVPSERYARKIREAFQGEPVRDAKALPFGWPRFVRYLGCTQAQIYYSDKMLNGGAWELYKHIHEGPQFLFVNDQNTRLLNDASSPVALRESSRKLRAPEGGEKPTAFYTKSYELSARMPEHIADLAQNKGVQWITPGGDYWEARVPDSMWAAARHPDTGEVILLVYSREGMHFLVTGSKLDVTKDGIVG